MENCNDHRETLADPDPPGTAGLGDGLRADGSADADRSAHADGYCYPNAYSDRYPGTHAYGQVLADSLAHARPKANAYPSPIS